MPTNKLSFVNKSAQYNSAKNFWYIDTGLIYSAMKYPVAYKFNNRAGWSCRFVAEGVDSTWVLKIDTNGDPEGIFSGVVYYI